MSIEPVNPEITAQAGMVQSMKGEIQHLEKLADGGAKNLEKVAAKFESIFLGFLIKQMWESVERSGLFEESSGRQVYDGMMVEMLSDHLAKQGGIGMAKALVTRLERAALAYEEQQAAVDDNEASGKTGEVESGEGDTHPLAGEGITKH